MSTDLIYLFLIKCVYMLFMCSNPFVKMFKFFYTLLFKYFFNNAPRSGYF